MSTPSSVADAGERALIELIRQRVPPPPSWVPLGIGDDAALVTPERNTADVYTTDALVDGVHFDRAFAPPDAIGHRALAVNLSDLAAMGARPRAALLSLVLPPDLPVADFTLMVDGLLALAARHGVALVGGNITRTTGPLTLDVTAIGSVHPRKALTRAGARPGDDVWVSGRIGAAAAGLASLAARPAGAAGSAAMAGCEEAYLRPAPRIRLGRQLAANRAATSCVDLSDGLADGLHQLSSASGLGIVIDPAAVPVDPDARQWFDAHGRDALQAALAGGDDYELLFTVNRRGRRSLRTVQGAIGDLPLHRIGRMTAAGGVRMATTTGEEPVPSGYEHFR